MQAARRLHDDVLHRLEWQRGYSVPLRKSLMS